MTSSNSSRHTNSRAHVLWLISALTLSTLATASVMAFYALNGLVAVVPAACMPVAAMGAILSLDRMHRASR